ncbi:MAG: ABC transporter ATP-binding protein [Eubacteriales bacterium]|nr:ABC transporter ATP-binding protein [Eubacteriales bacterium]
MKKPVIEFKDFSFKYKVQNEFTLHDINLTVYEGEKILILGPSGSGKSTLASCINGLIPFSYHGTTKGSCTVCGKDTKQLSIFKLSKDVGTVLQDSDAQFVGLSVGEDIAFAMENDMVPRAEMLKRVLDCATVVEMQKFLTALPFDLSGGQKQKVSLAGVMINDANILIFDEPLAALDPQMGVTTIDLIDSIQKRNNSTVVIVEHRLEDVLYRHIDRIILMSDGRIVADTTPNELLTGPLLKQHGIREPLYVTAMKYAGCTLTDKPTLCDIENLALTEDDKTKLKAFYEQPTNEIDANLGEEALRVENVSFAYMEEDVLRNVSLSIRKGERIAVVGKNGAGKSTLARLITGISRPRKGAIYIDGSDYMNLTIKEIGERVGYVMQNPNQMLVKDTIKAEVELALSLRKLPQEEINTRVKDVLTTCELYKMRNWPVDAVSYGQKKRVTIASIMALEPEVIILDEPTAGQDYKHYTDIIRFINKLNCEYGKTIIFITHDMHLAIENTDRAIVFADGELIADDSVFSVLSNDEIIKRANLKQTSLYTLARKLELPPEGFIEHFIRYERMVRPVE